MPNWNEAPAAYQRRSLAVADLNQFALSQTHWLSELDHEVVVANRCVAEFEALSDPITNGVIAGSSISPLLDLLASLEALGDD